MILKSFELGHGPVIFKVWIAKDKIYLKHSRVDTELYFRIYKIKLGLDTGVLARQIVYRLITQKQFYTVLFVKNLLDAML